MDLEKETILVDDLCSQYKVEPFQYKNTMETPQKPQGTTQVKQYIPQLVNVHISNGIVYNYPDPMLYLDVDYHELFV